MDAENYTAKAIKTDNSGWAIGNVIYKNGEAFIYCSDIDETFPVWSDTVCMYSNIDCTEDKNVSAEKRSIFMNDIIKLNVVSVKEAEISVSESVVVESIDGQPFFVNINIFHKGITEKVVCPLAWIGERLSAYGLVLKSVEILGNLNSVEINDFNVRKGDNKT